MIESALAILLGGAGVAVLYASWRSRSALGAWPTVSGWALLGLSACAWVQAAGTEFGLSYAALATSFAAWMAVLVNVEIRARGRKPQKTAAAVVPDAQSLAAHVARFVVAVPLAAVAAAFVGGALVRLMPVTRVDAMAAAAYGIPVLWGVLSYWATAAPRLARTAVSLSAAAAVSAVFVFAGSSP